MGCLIYLPLPFASVDACVSCTVPDTWIVPPYLYHCSYGADSLRISLGLCTPSEFRLRRYSCPLLHSLAISILLLSLVATSKSLLLCLSGVCRVFGSGDLVLCQYCSCWWCGKNASGFHLWSGSFSGSVGTNAVGGEGMPKPT